jgi:hypothetical protein
MNTRVCLEYFHLAILLRVCLTMPFVYKVMHIANEQSSSHYTIEWLTDHIYMNFLLSYHINDRLCCLVWWSDRRRRERTNKWPRCIRSLSSKKKRMRKSKYYTIISILTSHFIATESIEFLFFVHIYILYIYIYEERKKKERTLICSDANSSRRQGIDVTITSLHIYTYTGKKKRK